MSNNYHPLDEIDLIAQIADLKEVNYKNTLALTAIIELLVKRGIVSHEEILSKAKDLEVDLAIHFIHQNPPNPQDLN